MSTRAFLLVLLVLFPVTGLTQTCPEPPAHPEKGFNLFSLEQEQVLGEIIVEHIRGEVRIIEDETVTAPLQAIGDRLAAAHGLPKGQVRFWLVDLPDVNAFSLPGGVVLVSRKLVAFVRSEDELAGVLAHEFGHALSRHGAALMSQRLRGVLKVTSLGDRQDIADKYHQLIENRMRRPGAYRVGEGEMEREQIYSDQVAIYLMARAGYDPNAFATAWDRITENKGKTGSWLSDFFGSTQPASRRLREQLRAASALPAGCVDRTSRADAQTFTAWQQAAIAYSGLGRRESLAGLVSKRTLEPPLQADIQNLRFSPDGKYVMAQDESNIWILTREPFAPLFRIPSADAYDAQFTPDAKSVVFHNRRWRVETWDLESASRASVFELAIPLGCLQATLAPDGKTFACLQHNFDLRLLDTASGELVLEKKDFFVPTFFTAVLMSLQDILGESLSLRFVNMAFSPDGKWFAAVSASASAGLDMATRTKIDLPGGLQGFLRGGFAFLPEDRILGVNATDGKKSALVSFPAGKVITRMPMSDYTMRAATRGAYVIISPFGDYATAVVDLEKNVVVLRNRKEGFDLYDDQFLAERADGEVGLYRYTRPGAEQLAMVRLPRSDLAPLRAAAFSSDFSFLAVSQRTRSAVWDLGNGTRKLHMFPFRGVHFDQANVLYADILRRESVKPANTETDGEKKSVKEEAKEAKQDVKTTRVLGWVDLRSLQTKVVAELKSEERSRQYGAFLVALRRPQDEGFDGKDTAMEVKDVRTLAPLWSQAFPKEVPDYYISARQNTVTLVWPLKAGAAKAEINNNPELKRQQAAMREKDGDYLVQVRDLRTGKVTGQFLMETGKASFRIETVDSTGDWVIINDSENRVLVYALSSGQAKGRMVGTRSAVSLEAGAVCVKTDPGRLGLYDLATMQKRSEYTFSSDISFAQFSADGKRLFVLTSDQTAYVLDLNAGGVAAQTR